MGQDVEQLERQVAIAEARLGVAEEIGGIAALLTTISAVLAWDSWSIGIALGVISYVGITRRYFREESKATDAYQRASSSPLDHDGIGEAGSCEAPERQ